MGPTVAMAIATTDPLRKDGSNGRVRHVAWTPQVRAARRGAAAA
jgi:hypothetical protein